MKVKVKALNKESVLPGAIEGTDHFSSIFGSWFYRGVTLDSETQKGDQNMRIFESATIQKIRGKRKEQGLVSDYDTIHSFFFSYPTF